MITTLKERKKMNTLNKNKKLNVRTLTHVGLLSAIAVILMMFEIPLFFAPSFYKIDLSEVPVLIGTFAIGPVAGVCIELIKILLNFLLDGSTTAGVGEIANFLIGCAFIVPAGIIYKKDKTRKSAIIGMTFGTVFMAILGCFLNAYVLLPTYANAFQMPIEGLIEMGSAVNAGITDLFTFVVLAVAPFNLLKGVIVSVVVGVIYKKISTVLR